jgi:hypothetical protein
MKAFARAGQLIFFSCVTIFATLFAIAFAAAMRPSPVVFNVTATTERLEFKRPTVSHNRWLFHEATVVANNDDLAPHKVQGSLDIVAAATGTIERVSYGQLWIHLDCTQKTAPPGEKPCAPFVRIFDNNDRLDRAIHATTVDIFVDQIGNSAARGQTTMLTLSGAVDSGRAPGTEVLGNPSGRCGHHAGRQRVQRGRSLSGGSRGPLGGRSIQRDEGPVRQGRTAPRRRGRLRPGGRTPPDERPALTVAYRVEGYEATITRPGGGSYVVKPSTYERIVNDQFFRYVSGVLASIGGVTTLLSMGVRLNRRLSVQDQPRSAESGSGSHRGSPSNV